MVFIVNIVFHIIVEMDEDSKRESEHRNSIDWVPSDTWAYKNVDFSWSSEDDTIRMLHGWFDKLPKAKSNVVRVFISSTFTGE